MIAPVRCEELSEIWERLSTSVGVSVEDAVLGVIDHCARHECDETDVQGVLIDVCLKATDDPTVIVSMARSIETHGDRNVAWRSVLVASLGSMIGDAVDSGSPGPVAARREYNRLRRRWDLPMGLGRWGR